MPTNVVEVEDGEGEARETAHVDFIGSEPSGSADGVVIGALDVRKVDVPIGLLFAAHHGEQKSHHNSRLSRVKLAVICGAQSAPRQ